MHFRSVHPALLAALVIAAPLGCGDDANTDAADDSGTDGTTADTGTDGEESSESNGTTDDGTDSPESTDDATATDGETTATDGETTATDETTDGTDTGVDCAMFMDRIACLDAGCHPVGGQPIVGGGIGQACLGESEFLGCIPEQGCGDMPTWFCMGNEMFLVPDTCGPDGFDTCDGPPNLMDCP